MTGATLNVFAYDEKIYLNLLATLTRDLVLHPEWKMWTIAGDALISRSRSRVASRFLDEGHGDVLVMLDADIGCKPGGLEAIIDACVQREAIVAGVYPVRKFGTGVPLRSILPGKYVIPSDRVVEVEYASTGFMAIHRKVLEAVAATQERTIHKFWPMFQTETVHNRNGVEMLSEDWAFIARARKLGFKTFMSLKPELTHWGSHEFRLVDGAFQIPEDQPVGISIKG